TVWSTPPGHTAHRTRPWWKTPCSSATSVYFTPSGRWPSFPSGISTGRSESFWKATTTCFSRGRKQAERSFSSPWRGRSSNRSPSVYTTPGQGPEDRLCLLLPGQELLQRPLQIHRQVGTDPLYKG